MKKTWGDIADEFLACKTPEEARVWLATEVEREIEEFKLPREQAEANIRSSLGYMMGYYDDETAARMQKLLNLVHPILPWVGKEPNSDEHMEEALAQGIKIGKR